MITRKRKRKKGKKTRMKVKNNKWAFGWDILSHSDGIIFSTSEKQTLFAVCRSTTASSRLWKLCVFAPLQANSYIFSAWNRRNLCKFMLMQPISLSLSSRSRTQNYSQHWPSIGESEATDRLDDRDKYMIFGAKKLKFFQFWIDLNFYYKEKKC